MWPRPKRHNSTTNQNVCKTPGTQPIKTFARPPGQPIKKIPIPAHNRSKYLRYPRTINQNTCDTRAKPVKTFAIPCAQPIKTFAIPAHNQSNVYVIPDPNQSKRLNYPRTTHQNVCNTSAQPIETFSIPPNNQSTYLQYPPPRTTNQNVCNTSRNQSNVCDITVPEPQLSINSILAYGIKVSESYRTVAG